MSKERIEDYCIRAGKVHPWAEEAGTLIKVLQNDIKLLKDKLAKCKKGKVERLNTLLLNWVEDADTGQLDGVDLDLMVASERELEEK